MSATLTPPSRQHNPLRQRLAALRRRLRFVIAFRGVSWLVALLLGTCVLAGLADWLWHLPALIRAALLTGTLAAAGALLFRLLLRPLSARDDDLSLALKVEDHFPQLEDSLASTVEFLDETEPRDNGASPSMQREAVRRALLRAGRFNFDQIVDARGLRLAGVSAALALALAAALTLLSPSLALIGLTRLAHPFGPAEWPRQTRLELDPPRQRIGRNEAFTVRGTVTGVIPEKATILFRFEGFPSQEHEVEITQGEEGAGRLETTLPAGRVQRTFRFQVRANDAVSDEYRVEVLAPPKLVPLDGQPSPQVRLDIPAYTDLPTPLDLPPGTGNVEAVTGTVVTLRARASRPLARAWIEYQPQERQAPVAGFLAPLGVGSGGLHPRLLGALAALAGGAETWGNVPATLDRNDPSRFSVRFRPYLHGMYALHFEDEAGLHDQRLFELRLRPDPAPVVRLDRPTAARDLLTVLPYARLPLEVSVEDSQYAIRSVAVAYRTQTDPRPRQISLYDPDTFLHDHVAPLAGPAALTARPPRLRPTRLEFSRTLDLAKVRHADGRPLAAGDVLFLQAWADDYDDVTPGKAPGKSHQVEIKIVSRQEIDLELHDKQAEVQQGLLRLREQQRDALKKVRGAEDQLEKGEKLTPEQLDELLQAEQLQQQMRARIGDDKEGLRADVERIRRALRQNDLEHSAAQDRMRKVAEELARIADNELQRVSPRLNEARQRAELLDEKARAERRARLERQAQQAERDARAAEQTADRRETEAQEAEGQAADSTDEREKSRLGREATRARERAKELRAKAQALRKQAAALRREAAQKPDEAGPRDALADARRDQEEVEKTLNQLLADLEPWSNLREVKGEAGRILKEQRDLRQRVEELGKDPELTGKNRAELDPRQRAELDTLNDAQKRLEQRAADLIEKMKRVARDRAEKEPETAQDLEDAADRAEQGNLVGQMAQAADRIRANQLNDAAKKQAEGVQRLEDLIKALEDKREAELDRLSKKLKEAQRDLAELVKEQEKLQKKVKEAQALTDPAQRQEALSRLGREQERLSKKAEEMAERLSRLRAERARQALDQARKEMEDALQELTRGEKGEQDQQDALERLQEAQKELEQAQQQAEEELRRERLARVADVIKRFKERQEGLNRESERLQTKAQQEENWTRITRSSLLDLADNQKLLAQESEGVAEKDLKGAPVFARLMQRTAETMKQATERFEQMRQEPPAVVDLPDATASRLQALALKRLDQLVRALEEAANMPGQHGGGQEEQPGGMGGSGGGGGGNAGDGIPPLAQLKLLRVMQEDVNARTEAFRTKHPNLQDLDPAAKAELDDVHRDQKDVAELVEELRKSAAGAAEGAEEGK